MSTESGLKRVRITAPVDAEQLKALEIGDVVYLDGVIYTGREGLYRRVVTEGMAPPEGLFNLTNVNFHCSPAAAVNDDGS
jgi:L(+)-tartrate dehydratase beta subunit